MLIESWFKDARGDLQSAGIVECDTRSLVEHFRASDTLVVSSVWHDGEGTIYVSRSNKLSGVLMETSEVAFDNGTDAERAARLLQRLVGGIEYQIHDVSWVTMGDSRYVKRGTAVSFPDTDHVEVEGVAYEIEWEGDVSTYLKNGGRVSYTVNPKIIEGRKILSIKGLKEFSRKVVIEVEGGTLTLGHEQQCCEFVALLDFNGDAKDLVGKTVRVAEVKYGKSDETFYEIRTDGGDLWLRFGDAEEDSRYGTEIAVHWKPVSS